MKPELVSFKLCPFVQRSVITLLEKNVDFDIKYIDLANKPEWFLKISPFGKVPILKVGDEVLFESAVINEYLDEVNPPSMHPADPLQKAKNRAWIEFGSGILVDMFQMSMAENENAFEEKKKSLMEKLARVERQLGDSPYFNGKDFCLIDAAYAPALTRLLLLDKKLKQEFLGKTPKAKAWAETLANRQSVKKSVVPEFEDLFLGYIRGKSKFMAAVV